MHRSKSSLCADRIPSPTQRTSGNHNAPRDPVKPKAIEPKSCTDVQHSCVEGRVRIDSELAQFGLELFGSPLLIDGPQMLFVGSLAF